MAASVSAPRSVITAAILLLVYGGLSLLCGVCGSIGLAMGDLDPQKAPPFDPMFDSTWVKIVSLIAVYGAGLPMVIAGIGVLKLNRAARILGYVTSLVDLLINCFTLFGVAYGMSSILERVQIDLTVAVVFVFLGLYLVLRPVLDVSILIALSRPAARAAFSGVDADLPPKEG